MWRVVRHVGSKSAQALDDEAAVDQARRDDAEADSHAALILLPAAVQECTQHELGGGGVRLVVRIVGLDVSLIRRKSHGAVRGSRQHTATPASSSRGSSRICEYDIGGGMGRGGCEVEQGIGASEPVQTGTRRGMARDAACGAGKKAVCDSNASRDQKARLISNQKGRRMWTLLAS